MKLNPQALETLVSQIFVSRGCRIEEATCIAEHLVDSNLTGYDSHGVIRVPQYIQWLDEKKLIANRDLKLIIDSDALTVADGQLGFGLSLARQAVDIGIQKCRQLGVSLVGLRNCGHLGRIGHWSKVAADQGIIALHFVNSSGFGMFVVPSGGLDPRLSVNVISAGIPVEGQNPVVLDISAAAAAEGKLMVARNAGVSVPDDWIIDANGDPTNDPNLFYGPPRGAILPLGGHKGYGLGLVIDLLAGALTGGGCSSEGKTQLEQSMLGIYIDPEKLDTNNNIPKEVRRYIDFVRTSRPTDPKNKIRIPGENADSLRKTNAAGIEIDNSTWQQIAQTALTCGLNESDIEAALAK